MPSTTASQTPCAWQVEIIQVIHKDATQREASEKLYEELAADGLECLLDDRKLSPGVKFADADLIGVPHRITVGDRALKDGNVEYKARSGGDAEAVPLTEVLNRITQDR